MQLVEAEKGRIRKEYERKEGQVEVMKKMYVSPTTTTMTVVVGVVGVVTEMMRQHARIIRVPSNAHE